MIHLLPWKWAPAKTESINQTEVCSAERVLRSARQISLYLQQKFWQVLVSICSAEDAPAESWFSHLCPYEPNGIERSMKHYYCGFIIVEIFEHQFSWISLSSSLKYIMYMTTFSFGSLNNNHAFSTNFLSSVKFYETHKNWCPQVFQKPYKLTFALFSGEVIRSLRRLLFLTPLHLWTAM